MTMNSLHIRLQWFNNLIRGSWLPTVHWCTDSLNVNYPIGLMFAQNNQNTPPFTFCSLVELLGCSFSQRFETCSVAMTIQYFLVCNQQAHMTKPIDRENEMIGSNITTGKSGGFRGANNDYKSGNQQEQWCFFPTSSLLLHSCVTLSKQLRSHTLTLIFFHQDWMFRTFRLLFLSNSLSLLLMCLQKHNWLPIQTEQNLFFYSLRELIICLSYLEPGRFTLWLLNIWPLLPNFSHI